MQISDRIEYYYPELDKERVRAFMRALFKVSKKKKYSELLKNNLKDQMEKARKVSIDRRSSKERITQEMEKLQESVEKILKAEHHVVIRQEEESNNVSMLAEKLNLLHEKFDLMQKDYEKKLSVKEGQIMTLKDSVDSLRSSVVGAKTKEGARIQKQLKKEFDAKFAEREKLAKIEIESVENHIKLIEGDFNKLKKKKDTSKYDLQRVKERLASAKHSLRVLKKTNKKE